MSASEPTENTGPDVAATNATSSAPALPADLAAARAGLAGVAASIAFAESADALNVTVPIAALLDVCRVARHQLGYRLLASITGVDWKDSYELVYHLYRLDSAYPLVIRSRLPHDEAPTAPSLTPEWPGAEFQEREVYDLLGIVFAGHPDLRRILLDDDFAGHPLRKDYQADPDYVLVAGQRLPGYAGATPGRTSTGRFLPPSDASNDAKKDGGHD